MKIYAFVVLAACGGAIAPAPTPAANTQPVVQDVPAAAGQGGELPSDIPTPPPAQPEAAAAAAAPRAESDVAASGPRGTIVGQAWYAGPACAQATWPPQCNGAYRQNWVWIWSHGTQTWLRAAYTDNDGRYTFVVDPGRYTIMLQTGFSDRWWYNRLDVAPFETITSNLVVDWGVR